MNDQGEDVCNYILSWTLEGRGVYVMAMAITLQNKEVEH
jgi:hypothetical protein